MKIKLRNTLLWLALPLAGRADLSLVLTPGTTGGFADPVQLSQQPWRIEFQLHDWVFPPVESYATKVFDMSGTGVYASLVFGGIRFFNDRDGSQCIVSLFSRTNVLIRLQRDPVGNRFSCEVWNYDGTGYVKSFDALNHPAATAFAGAGFGSPTTTARLAWFRMFNTVLNDASLPQTTAVGNSLNYTFESNVLDTSGNGRHLNLASPTFQPTPNVAPPVQTPNPQTGHRSDFFLQ